MCFYAHAIKLVRGTVRCIVAVLSSMSLMKYYQVLGQPGIKEQGQQVLRGEQSIPLRRGSQSSK